MPIGDGVIGDVRVGDLPIGDIVLDVADTRHEHNSNTATWENFIMNVLNSVHGSNVDNATLTQLYYISASNLRHIQRDNVRTIVEILLESYGAVHGQNATVAMLVNYILDTVSARHGHNMDMATLIQTCTMVSDSIRHIMDAESGMTAYGYLSPADTRHIHRIVDAVLYVEGEEGYKLIISSLVQGVLDDIAITQEHTLAPLDATHSHRIEDAVLNYLMLKLSVASASHSVNVESVLITQVVKLAIASAIQDLRLDGNISQEQLLDVSNLRQIVRLEDVTVTEGLAALLKLIVSSGRHGQNAGFPTLTQLHQMIVSDIRHPHVARLLGVAIERIPMILDTFIELYMSDMSITSNQAKHKIERFTGERKTYNA